jgi:hypothetical protein
MRRQHVKCLAAAIGAAAHRSLRAFFLVGYVVIAPMGETRRSRRILLIYRQSSRRDPQESTTQSRLGPITLAGTLPVLSVTRCYSRFVSLQSPLTSFPFWSYPDPSRTLGVQITVHRRSILSCLFRRSVTAAPHTSVYTGKLKFRLRALLHLPGFRFAHHCVRCATILVS